MITGNEYMGSIEEIDHVRNGKIPGYVNNCLNNNGFIYRITPCSNAAATK